MYIYIYNKIEGERKREMMDIIEAEADQIYRKYFMTRGLTGKLNDVEKVSRMRIQGRSLRTFQERCG